jgi:hypothetical protein
MFRFSLRAALFAPLATDTVWAEIGLPYGAKAVFHGANGLLHGVINRGWRVYLPHQGQPSGQFNLHCGDTGHTDLHGALHRASDDRVPVDSGAADSVTLKRVYANSNGAADLIDTWVSMSYTWRLGLMNQVS